MTVSWDTLQIGWQLPPFVDDPLTITDFVRYQGASGDMNPIHHDVEFARRAGYDTPIAVGMLQAGVLSTYASDLLGVSNLRRFAFRFREQAHPGDVLTYRGSVVARRTGPEPMVDLELSCTRQTGGVHLVGTATYVVPR